MKLPAGDDWQHPLYIWLTMVMLAFGGLARMAYRRQPESFKRVGKAAALVAQGLRSGD